MTGSELKMTNGNTGLQAQWQDLDNSSFVHQAYLRLLGRSADPEGLQDSVAKLDAGVPRNEVSATLADSEEGRHYASRRNALRHGPGTVIASTVQPPTQEVSRALAVAAVSHLSHVNELLALDGAAFIASAYQTLLNREVDPEGFRIYLTLLQGGWTKLHIAKALFESKEGRKVIPPLSGLSRALQHHAKAQRRSWLGWYWRNVQGAESDLPADRERRALAYRLHVRAGV
jgi:hypothetical protein